MSDQHQVTSIAVSGIQFALTERIFLGIPALIGMPFFCRRVENHL
jgi:hypothetical protein